MAKLPVPQERVMFSGASFSSSAGGAGRQLPLANALTQWAAQRREEQTNEALIRVQNSAVTAQQQVGTVGLAEAPEDTTGVFRQAFEQKARATFSQLSLTDAQRTINRLARKHPDDPERFSTAFNDYMVGQVMPLREVNASAAFELQTTLDRLGNEQLAAVQSNAATRARTEQQALALEGLQAGIAESRDAVQSAGNEIELANQLQIMEAEYNNLHESQLISTEAWLTGKRNIRENLTRDMYFGQLDQLLENGDMPGITGLIEHAREGLLFDDNDRGRVLASQLEQELRRRTDAGKGVAEGVMAAHRGTANDGLSSYMRTGRQPTSPLFDQALIALANSDNANDRQTARQIEAAFQLGDLPARIEEQDLEGLGEGLDQLGALVGQLPGETISAAEQRIEARRLEILEAQRSRDPQAVFDDAAAAEEQAGFDWWAKKRASSAYITGTPIDEVPLYSRAKAESTAGLFSDALQRERPSDALEILLDYMPSDKIPTPQIAAVAMQHNVPELASAGTMLALGGEDLTRTVLALSSAGRGATDRDRGEALNDLKPKDDEAIREIADTLSMGSSATARRIEADLRSAHTGLWLRQNSNDSDEAEAARQTSIDDLLEPLKARDTLANGQRVPRGFFPPATIAEINTVLGDEAAEFFGEDALNRFSVETYLPVPGPDGSVFFRSETEPGVFIGPDPEPGERREPFKLTTQPPSLEEQVRTGFDLEGNMLASRGTNIGSSTSQSLREIPMLAGAVGADERTLRALFVAAQATPERQVTAEQNFAAGFDETNMELLDLPEYDRVWESLNPPTPDGTGRLSPPPPVPDPWNSPDGSLVAASLILAELEKKFRDPEQIMLAYRIGAAEVEAAGDNWRELLPAESASFMGRVRNALK